MDVAVEDLIVIGPDRDATLRAVLDFKSVDEVIIAINGKADIPIRGILSINDGASRSL